MKWDEETRRAEIFNQRVGIAIGTFTLLAGFVTALAAVLAAKAATQAVSTAQDAVLRASREQRFSSGVEAMGGDTAAQRIAGIGLLSRSVANELTRVYETQGSTDPGEWERDRRDVRATYLSTIDALENYVGTWRTGNSHLGAVDPVAKGATPTSDQIVGYVVPKDVSYATNELKSMTSTASIRTAAKALHAAPAVDLTSAPLARLNLKDLDVSWLNGFYAPDIDLRQATLTDTVWGSASLVGGHLQCANLTGADLRGADLTDVDLRGAILTDAVLDDATVTGALLRDAVLDEDQLKFARGGDHVGGASKLRTEPMPDCMAKRGHSDQ